MEAFDTHDAYNELNKAGIEPAHSEAILKVITRSRLDSEGEYKSVKEEISNCITKKDGEALATKADIAVLDSKIDALDSKFESKISVLDSKIDALDAKFDARFDSVLKEIFKEMDLRFSKMQFSMLKYTVGLVITIVATMAGLIRYLQ